MKNYGVTTIALISVGVDCYSAARPRSLSILCCVRRVGLVTASPHAPSGRVLAVTGETLLALGHRGLAEGQAQRLGGAV